MRKENQQFAVGNLLSSELSIGEVNHHHYTGYVRRPLAFHYRTRRTLDRLLMHDIEMLIHSDLIGDSSFFEKVQNACKTGETFFLKFNRQLEMFLQPCSAGQKQKLSPTFAGLPRA
jgi:hypothetical protein